MNQESGIKSTLKIDTSSNKEIIVSLIKNDREDAVRQQIGEQKAQAVLLLIDAMLAKHALSLQDIKAIEVNTGPGSFTGLRVGVAVANTLGMRLKIPINSQPTGVLAEPRYT